MRSLFDSDARKSILERLDGLSLGSSRQWGKMDASQMLAHCSAALERGTGDAPSRQMLIGKLLAPFFRSSML